MNAPDLPNIVPPERRDPDDALVRIVADDRENAGGVIAELRKMPGVGLTVNRLPAGDFLVGECFAIERKTLFDFAQSVLDGRLFRQAAALSRDARRGVLILEGTGKDLHSSAMSRESMQGAMITVSVFYGLAVLRAVDAAETARLLVYIGRQVDRFARGALKRPGYRPKGRRARQLFVLQGLPGIGPERASRLLEHFGSVENVAKASEEELLAVGGIGDTTAAKIRWVLEESPGEYDAHAQGHIRLHGQGRSSARSTSSGSRACEGLRPENHSNHLRAQQDCAPAKN